MNKYIIILSFLLLLFSTLTLGTIIKEGYTTKRSTVAEELKKDVSKESRTNPSLRVAPSETPISQELDEKKKKELIEKTNYKADNYDVQYHDSEQDIITQDDLDLELVKPIYVKDASGNVVELPWTSVKGNTTYNEPGTFRYESSNYVPNYEDSVYLSRLTGLSYTKPVYDTASQLGGFCSFNKNSGVNTETACLKLDKNTCASTSCCVLLGGAKCVAGNENGPTMKSNYSDIYLKNKDFYFYQGKCYGNCRM
jgi:hypothetical protein